MRDKSIDFLSGFRYAVHLLGHKGDYENADWASPYRYLKGELEKLEKDYKPLPTAMG